MDKLTEAKKALQASRQYQKDWQEYGVDRVCKYFDDVEGDWLEEFEPINPSPAPLEGTIADLPTLP